MTTIFIISIYIYLQFRLIAYLSFGFILEYNK